MRTADLYRLPVSSSGEGFDENGERLVLTRVMATEDLLQQLAIFGDTHDTQAAPEASGAARRPPVGLHEAVEHLNSSKWDYFPADIRYTSFLALLALTPFPTNPPSHSSSAYTRFN